jgi:hypothetical protein
MKLPKQRQLSVRATKHGFTPFFFSLKMSASCLARAVNRTVGAASLSLYCESPATRYEN